MLLEFLKRLIVAFVVFLQEILLSLERVGVDGVLSLQIWPSLSVQVSLAALRALVAFF